MVKVTLLVPDVVSIKNFSSLASPRSTTTTNGPDDPSGKEVPLATDSVAPPIVNPDVSAVVCAPPSKLL